MKQAIFSKITIRTSRLLVIFLVVLLTTGFRVHLNSDGTVARWYVHRNDPTVWLRFCDESLVFDSIDLPGSDPFHGYGSELQDVMQSIMDDFNQVNTSFFRFARYPDDPNQPPIPEPEDSSFTTTAAKIRTIDLCFGDLPYYAAAQAEFKTNEDACDTIDSQPEYQSYCQKTWLYSCNITFNKSIAEESLSGFIHTVTHELGHCVGFLHNHDTHLSIMSYVADPKEILRLQMDDKIGLTYLYPQEDSYNDEEPTLGLTGCD